MKKIILILVLICLLSAYPIINIMGLSLESAQAAPAADLPGTDIIESLSAVDVKKAEKNVRDAEAKRLDPTGNYQKVEKVLNNLKKGKTTYRKIFKNVYIVGDSLMNGLEAYNILNSNHLITQVSASLYHLKDNVDKIIASNPPMVILHYGINMISAETKYYNNFISMYTGIIKQLKKALPETRFVVSGLFPVEKEVATAKRFEEVGKYNKGLKKMCDELKIEFIDSSSVLKAHPECYGGDGIHLSKSFYEKYWLKYLIKKLGIVG